LLNSVRSPETVEINNLNEQDEFNLDNLLDFEQRQHNALRT
jgi:hypothetical protein